MGYGTLGNIFSILNTLAKSFSGNGDQQLRRPSVNSSTVYDSLFNEESFLSIFSAGNAEVLTVLNALL